MDERGFVDPTKLTNLVKKSLNVFWMLTSFMLAYDLFYFLLFKKSALHITSDWYIVLSLFYVPMFLTTMVLVLMWLYRANHNVRQLGATGMKFSPTWSIAWFFIPFANFVQPRAILTELWKTSSSPTDWQKETASILAFRCGVVTSLFIFLKISKAFAYIRSNPDDVPWTYFFYSYGADITGIFLSLLMIAYINRVYSMQMSHCQSKATPAITV